MPLRLCVDCNQPHEKLERGRCHTCNTNHQRWRNKQPNRRLHFTAYHRHLADTVIRRDGRECRVCGGTDDLTLDYIVPLAKGGQPIIDNAQCLCRSCNSAKRDR